MNYTKQIGQTLVTLLLFAALITPTVVQFLHSFETHTHLTCTETSSTHLHEIDAQCTICDFHFTPFKYESTQYSYSATPKVYVKVKTFFATIPFQSFKITNTQLRAPPVNS